MLLKDKQEIIDFILREYQKTKSHLEIAKLATKKFGTKITRNNVYDWALRNSKVISNPTINKYDKGILNIVKDSGLNGKQLHDLIYRHELQEKKEYEIKKPVRKFKVGYVSDTHLGVRTCAIKELHDIYDRFEKEGITEVLHSGDFMDGIGKVYPGQVYELTKVGFDDMLEHCIEEYPKRNGMTTYLIGGNHDEDSMKNGGANLLKTLVKYRDDIKYLGMYDAYINIGGVKFQLHHGAGGGSYAHSYKIQKYVENLTGENKPQVFLLGHYHTQVYMRTRNIHCLTGASFQKANDFSKRLMLPEIIGGTILEIETSDDNTITKFIPNFINYYF